MGTKFQDIIQTDLKQEERAGVKAELFDKLKSAIAEKLYDVDSEYYGGFVFSWSDISLYRRGMYERKASEILMFMGYNRE